MKKEVINGILNPVDACFGTKNDKMKVKLKLSPKLYFKTIDSRSDETEKSAQEKHKIPLKLKEN